MKKSILIALSLLFALLLSACSLAWQTSPDKPNVSNTPTENTNYTPTAKPEDPVKVDPIVQNEPDELEEDPVEEAPAPIDNPAKMEPHLIQPREEFVAGSYFELENTIFLYNGESFEITNNRNDYVIISVWVVGVKKDGTYEQLEHPAFGGVDVVQYDKDMEENGWAIEEFTNRVRPGETLIADMEILDWIGCPADIDRDGYYDLVFNIYPQVDEEQTVISTDAPEAGPFKLKSESEPVDDPPIEIEWNIPSESAQIEKHLIETGEEFVAGSYIDIEGIEILYNGEEFEITNNREGVIWVNVSVVGVKNDGTYEFIQKPSFGGLDRFQYEKDMEENGWAIEHYTTSVRPEETLVAMIDIWGNSSDYYPPDIDGDGYYDLVFSVHPEETKDYVTISFDNPEAGPYKLKAE